MFKRIQKDMVGKKLVFNVEGSTDIHGAQAFYGDKTELEYNHEIIGYVPSSTMLGEIEDNYGVASGTILSASHAKENGSVTFHVKLQGAYSYASQACY